MTVYAIIDTKKGRTGIAPTYLQTTLNIIYLQELKNSRKKIPNRYTYPVVF